MQTLKLKFFLGVVIFGIIAGCAPDDSSYYDISPSIPHFTLVNIDSAQITQDDLEKGKQTLIIFFSPDCSHCGQLTHTMLNNIDKLQDTEILMTTYQPLDDMIAFYRKYELVKYANIKLGRDTKYFFIPFYKITRIPFIAFYG